MTAFVKVFGCRPLTEGWRAHGRPASENLDICDMYARARVMGSYPEIVAKPNICVTENQRRRCASAIRARPGFVLGPVDIPP